MIELCIRFGTVTNTLTLDDGEYTVGRASQNDVQIPSSRASKHHAVIRIEGERLYVRDLGSTNGTAIDGVVVDEDEVEVPPHATLDFAGATLQRSQPGDTKSGASAARLTNATACTA